MFKFSFVFITSLASLILMGCQARHFETQIWRAGQGPIPEWSQLSDFKPLYDQMKIGDEIVLRHRQYSNTGQGVQNVGGIPIQGSSRTEIRDSQKPIWLSQVAVDSPLHLGSKAELLAFRLRQEKIFQRIHRNIGSEKMHLDQAPSLVVQQIGDQFKTLIRAPISHPKTGEFFEDLYSLSGSFISRKRLGASFELHSPLPAQIFPKGPQKSGLSWVNLEVNQKLKSLSNSRLKVQSQSGINVEGGGKSLSFALEDPRFDQVQVFYYIEQFLSQMNDRHKFQLPRPLSIETDIGYPEKTNAAFYYAFVLRFGAGDGLTFTELMRDPTVITHEVGHAVIDALSELPFQGEAGSINEGIADFLAASALDTPLMAEASFVKGPYRRNLANKKSYSDKVGKLYADSEIISGLFWQLRDQLGPLKSERLALRILPRLLPNANFDSLKSELLLLVQQLEPEDKAKVDLVLRERKWL